MLVSGHGPENAIIMLIADYAMHDDVKSGNALSAAQDRTLRELFHEQKYDLSATYRTTLIKTSIEYDGKSKKLKEAAIKSARLSSAYNFDKLLREEIMDVKPNILVPLGDHALRFCSGYSPLTAYRGSVLPLAPSLQYAFPHKVIRVIPTYHPRMIWQDITSKVFVRLDIEKIVRLREETGPIEKAGIVWVCRTVSDWHRWISRMPKKKLNWDVEHYLGFLTAISFCLDGKEAISVPMNSDEVDAGNAMLLMVEMAKLLKSDIPKGNVNANHDRTMCDRWGLTVNNITFDPTITFNLLYPELPKNLGFQNSIYTDLPYFKDEAKSKDTQYNPKSHERDKFYLYNAKDSLSSWQIDEAQQEELKESGLHGLYHQKLMPLLNLYYEISNTGLRVDLEKRRALKNKYTALADINAFRFHKLVESVIQFDTLSDVHAFLRSPTKIGDLLYNRLKFPPRYQTTDGGKQSFKTDKDTLDELYILFGLENKLGLEGKKAIRCIISARKLHKIREYIATPLYPDNTFRGVYNLAGTKAARTSCSKSLDTVFTLDAKGKLKQIRMGRSLQTLTKHGFEVDDEIFDSLEDQRIGADVRSMFVPRPGKIFIEGDESQAEARVVAVLAEDWELLESFDKKPKIHAKTAGLIFDIDPTTITKDFPVVPDIGIAYYDLGKRIRHAGHYDMGGFRLSQMTHLDKDLCDQLMEKFHSTNPKIRNIYHEDVRKAMRKSMTLVSPFGRIRQFFKRLDDKLIKEALSVIPQSTVSDQLKFSMLRIREKAPWASMIVEAHDSLLAEVEPSQKSDYCEIFHECTETPINFEECTLSRDFNLTIPTELTWGDNWRDLEEIKA